MYKIMTINVVLQIYLNILYRTCNYCFYFFYRIWDIKLKTSKMKYGKLLLYVHEFSKRLYIIYECINKVCYVSCCTFFIADCYL